VHGDGQFALYVPPLVGILSAEYPETEHVLLLGMGKDGDTDIWDFAGSNGYAIVSKDKDFYQRTHKLCPFTHWSLYALAVPLRTCYSIQNLLTITRIKAEAASNSVTSVELSNQRLILHRNGSPMLLDGSRFPRLTKTATAARLFLAIFVL